MSNRIYKVLTFSVPINHTIVADDWHFETPQSEPLVRQMEDALNELAKEGWRVVGSQTLLEGQYRLPLQPGDRDLSLGYSVTTSLLLILEKDT